MRTCLAILCSLALTLPAAAAGLRFVKQFSQGPLPAGMTFGGDKVWSLEGRFEPLNGDRHVLVGYPGYAFEDGARKPVQTVYPVLDLKTMTVVLPRFDTRELFAETIGDFVHYDPDKGQAGFWRYLGSHSDKRYQYVHWDLGQGAIAWTVDLAAGNKRASARPIGVEPTGRYFYFFEERHSSKDLSQGQHADEAVIARLDLQSREIDWRHSLKLPGRTGLLVGGLDVHPSSDYRFFAVTEYSEPSNGKVSPPPMVYVVDAAKDRHLTMPVPLTPYGVAFDRQNRYLAIGSNAEAKLYRYDLSKGKRDMALPSVRRIHALALSGDNQRLYVMGKEKTFELRAWPSLKLVKRLPASAMMKGLTMLDPEGVAVTADGRFAVMHKTEGPWGFADKKNFFAVAL